MPLAPGTALQNGHYVVDALLEAAPNGDLYWGTHVMVGMPVFIQVFPLVGEPGQSDLSSLIARLEGVAFSPQSPLPNPFQLFRGDDQTLCLAMGTTVGLPWSSARKNCSPLSPKQALAKIRQIADSVIWLKEQGLSGLDLAPNRVWLSPDQPAITLTGLPHAYLQNSVAQETGPDTSAQALAKLLFSFLTGQAPAVLDGEGSASVEDQLKQHCPNLSPVIVAAIAQGLQSGSHDAPAITLPQWLQQLPDAGATHQVSPPSQQLVRSRPTPVDQVRSAAPPQRPQKVSPLLPALTGTALLAAIAGVTLGTFWRLNGQGLPGAIQLDPQQSFPTQAEWPGDTPKATFDAPYVPASNVPLRQDDWYETPAPETYEASPPFEPVNNAVEAADDFNPDVNVGSDLSDDSFDGDTGSPSVPLEALPDAPQAPAEPDVAPFDPYDVPEVAPLETDSTDFSNVNDALLQPSPMAAPKALPASEAASKS